MVDYVGPNGPLPLFSTAPGIQTPEQVKATIDYAKALMTGSGQQPVKHWTQGVSNVVNALVGGDLDYRAAQKQKEAQDVAGGQLQSKVPTQNYPGAPVGTNSPPPIVGNGATPPPFPAPLPSGGSNNEMDRSGKAISGIESGGRYDLVGPVTKTGDRAYGKYQVMGNNIPEWTEATLGKRMTPAEYLADKDAQEAVFRNKFGEYTSKYGPEGAAKAWFAGEKGMNNPNAKDILGTTVDSYGKRFSNAFAGPDNFSKVPAVAAMSEALRGGPSDAGSVGVQVAGGKATPGAPVNLQRPDPEAGQTFIKPELIKPQPGYTQEQLRAVLGNPWISAEDRAAALQMMTARGQTIEMRSPTGVGTVFVDPNNSRVQQYFAPEPHWGTKKVTTEGVEQPIGITFDAAGKPVIAAPAPAIPPGGRPAIGPRSEAPVAPTEGTLPTNGTPGTPVAENAPVSPVGASDVPVKVASTDPAAGVVATVGKPTVPPVSPLSNLAQVMKTAPPGVSQEDFDIIQGLRKAKLDADAAQHQRINDMDVNKSAQEKMAELAIKKYDTLSGQGQAARKQMPHMDLALALMNDPNFHSGAGSPWQDLLSRVKDMTGIAPGENASNETFDKLIASTILGGIKDVGGGQIRNSEIMLLTKANGNRSNSDASNRAVLEVSRRALQTTDHLDQLGQAYISGDEVRDPLNPEKVLLKANIGPDGEIAQRRGLDSGYDKLARKFMLEHPSFSPEEIKRYNTIFETGKDPNVVATTATGKTNEALPKVGETKDFSDGKGGTIKGQWDGAKWGPVK